MRQPLSKLIYGEDGQDLVEYAFLAIFIAIVLVVVLGDVLRSQT